MQPYHTHRRWIHLADTRQVSKYQHKVENNDLQHNYTAGSQWTMLRFRQGRRGGECISGEQWVGLELDSDVPGRRGGGGLPLPAERISWSWLLVVLRVYGLLGFDLGGWSWGEAFISWLCSLFTRRGHDCGLFNRSISTESLLIHVFVRIHSSKEVCHGQHTTACSLPRDLRIMLKHPFYVAVNSDPLRRLHKFGHMPRTKHISALSEGIR